MIRFAWPWMALLVPLPWLHYRARRAALPASAAIFLPFAADVLATPMATRAAPANRRAWLFTALWLLLLLAAMRPQWLGDPLPAPTTGRRIILAVDVSGSMATPDMANNTSRLQVVQQVAGRFIDGRQGDQVGLILFGTQPYVQAPLTPDLPTVHRFLDEALVGVAGRETAIGDAIGMALKRLQAERANAARRALIAVGASNPVSSTPPNVAPGGNSNCGWFPPPLGGNGVTVGAGGAYTNSLVGPGAPGPPPPPGTAAEGDGLAP